MHLYKNIYDDEREEERVYEFLTPKDVMEELSISKGLFYSLARSGQIPAFRIGKQWRVKRSELMNWKPQK